MLITNKQFLNYIATKKLIVAYDVSGAHPTYTATMRGLDNNCTSKNRKPIMITFNHDVRQIFDFDNYTRCGGTDIKRCINFIKQIDKPDTILYITDGAVAWPINNLLKDIEQYIHLLDNENLPLLPNYVKLI